MNHTERRSPAADRLGVRFDPITIGLLALALSGCALSERERAMRDWITADAREWRLSDTSAIHTHTTLESHVPEGSDPPLPAGATVEDYVRIALVNNPSIRAAREKVARLEARVPQVSSPEDPMFGLAPVGNNEYGGTNVMTEFSQKLPFPGKLQAMGNMAISEARMAAEELRQARLVVINNTRSAYWTLYYTVRAIRLTHANRELLSQLKDAAMSRYRANLASQQDVLKAGVELSDADNKLIDLEQELTTARAMLSSLLDRPVAAPIPDPVDAKLFPAKLDVKAMLAQAARSNPELAAIHRRIEGERQRLKLARLNRWPDLTLTLKYDFMDGNGMAPPPEDEWSLMFGVNLPIWTPKLDAGQREALHGIGQGVAELTAMRNRIAFEIQDAVTRVQAQDRMVELLRTTILPQAKQTVEASLAGYQSGKDDFLSLIDSSKNLLSFQLAYEQAVAEREKSLAQLQQLLGKEEQSGPATQDRHDPALRSKVEHDSR